MKTFVAEVPRFFTKFEAKDATDAIKKLQEQASEFVDEFAVVEEVTGQSIPTAKEAMTVQRGGLLHKIVSIFEMGKSISKAVGGQAYLGVGDADVYYSRNLFEDVAGTAPETASFISLGGFLGKVTPDVSEAGNQKVA